MRRKPDSLLPIELSILQAGVAMRSRGADEFHGYAVAKEIRESVEARRLTAHGTLYRALERLEQRGLLESRLEDPDLASAERRPRRRLYTVTALGISAEQASERASPAPVPGVQRPGAATS
ncbi:MAG: helix-turn-helix transcriptional regulator [bacterium]